MGETQADSPFWRFSLGFYRRPGVSEACIALQDDCGADVNVVLLLLWLASTERRVALAEVQAVCAKATPWRDDVVAPLRAVRRKLKEGSSLVERGTAELFRTKIKAIELESERLQQEGLFALASALPTQPAPPVEAARAGIAIYEQVLGRAFSPNAVDVLVSALAAGSSGAGPS